MIIDLYLTLNKLAKNGKKFQRRRIRRGYDYCNGNGSNAITWVLYGRYLFSVLRAVYLWSPYNSTRTDYRKKAADDLIQEYHAIDLRTMTIIFSIISLKYTLIRLVWMKY